MKNMLAALRRGSSNLWPPGVWAETNRLVVRTRKPHRFSLVRKREMKRRQKVGEMAFLEAEEEHGTAAYPVAAGDLMLEYILCTERLKCSSSVRVKHDTGGGFQASSSLRHPLTELTGLKPGNQTNDDRSHQANGPRCSETEIRAPLHSRVSSVMSSCRKADCRLQLNSITASVQAGKHRQPLNDRMFARIN
ncbi:hypothetical protein NQZ68_001217 [Dissostichus eleginoides]|nr:hypothetical protein NQZ68_001217 [Dissostichus eleginoides]